MLSALGKASRRILCAKHSPPNLALQTNRRSPTPTSARVFCSPRAPSQSRLSVREAPWPSQATTLHHPGRASFSVPLYNEPAYVLQRTLSGLAMQQEDLRRCAAAGAENQGRTDIPALHVLVIADGDAKVSPTMRAYLQEMFPAYTARTFDPSWYEDESDPLGQVEQPKDAEWRKRPQVMRGGLAAYGSPCQPHADDGAFPPSRRSLPSSTASSGTSARSTGLRG